ncbi:adenylate kinase [Actinomycetes bacterium]|nr:adenylate kinase [Actinomycetes bacterium]
MRLIMMGPPGAGKGTQADIVCAGMSIPHISTGDIFRANVSEGTALGIEAKRYMDAGEYVPDGVTNAMVRDRLEQADCAGGFLLDGYPRTIEQVGELDAMLGSQGVGIDAVVELIVDSDEVVQRLVNRALDQGRADDTEEVIRRRLEVFAEQTRPLTSLYASRGLLTQVSGMGDIADVTARIEAAISASA